LCAGVIHHGHFIIVVQSPSSEVFPPCPVRPRRGREGDWTKVLEFMDECDSEFPVWFVEDDEGYEGDCDCSLGEPECFVLRWFTICLQILCRVMVQILSKGLIRSGISYARRQVSGYLHTSSEW